MHKIHWLGCCFIRRSPVLTESSKRHKGEPCCRAFPFHFAPESRKLFAGNPPRPRALAERTFAKLPGQVIRIEEKKLTRINSKLTRSRLREPFRPATYSPLAPSVIAFPPCFPFSSLLPLLFRATLRPFFLLLLLLLPMIFIPPCPRIRTTSLHTTLPFFFSIFCCHYSRKQPTV